IMRSPPCRPSLVMGGSISFDSTLIDRGSCAAYLTVKEHISLCQMLGCPNVLAAQSHAPRTTGPPAKATGDVMRQITVIAGALAWRPTVAAADPQGIGSPPGVNPSNPQDLTYRSNPQDLTVPGGSNRQDLVRPSPTINGPRPFPDRREVTSVP